MKKYLFIVGLSTIMMGSACAQDLKSSDVPTTVKEACMKRFPTATKISWEKENGNYEANWGGKSGEDNAAMFTPAAVFIEIVKAIAISDLPASVAVYIKEHENGATIREAGLVTDANGIETYEAEIKGKDLIFDKSGKFIKAD